jgi:hypothetical protein
MEYFYDRNQRSSNFNNHHHYQAHDMTNTMHSLCQSQASVINNEPTVNSKCPCGQACNNPSMHGFTANENEEQLDQDVFNPFSTDHEIDHAVNPGATEKEV